MRKTQKALVTGGAGFVGSHIVDELLRQQTEVFVIDDLSSGTLENLRQHENNSLLHIIKADVRNVDSLIHDENNIDVVFHEAAIVSVLRSVQEPYVVHDVNVNMTLQLMDFCVEKKIKRFIFASSAAVYGLDRNVMASEDMVCKPQSPYGASKLAVENYLNAYYHTYDFEPVILRYFNIFGPRQKLNDYSGVITIFINKLLHNEIPVVHWDGKQSRDFVNVKDIVYANMLAMNSQNAVGETFNVASGKAISILELLQLLKEITGTELSHKFEPKRPGDVRYGSASTKRIKEKIGFTATVDKKNGLAEVVSYLKEKSKVRDLMIKA